MSTDPRATEIAGLLGRLAELMAATEHQTPPEPTRPLPERLLLTVEEAAEQLGIGRTLMYQLVRTGEVESIRIGRLRRVPTTAIRDYTTRLGTDPRTNTAA